MTMTDTIKRKLASVKLWILLATLVQFNVAAYVGLLDGPTYVGAILGAFALYTGGNVSSKFAFARLTPQPGNSELVEVEDVG